MGRAGQSHPGATADPAPGRPGGTAVTVKGRGPSLGRTVFTRQAELDHGGGFSSYTIVSQLELVKVPSWEGVETPARAAGFFDLNNAFSVLLHLYILLRIRHLTAHRAPLTSEMRQLNKLS